MADLHMLQLQFEQQKLFQWVRQTHGMDQDSGYLVHSVLGALFGRQMPKPFVVQTPPGRYLRVLAYDNRDAETLMELAHTFALPEALSLLDRKRIYAKRMPLPMAVGKRLGFSMTVCPIARKAKDGPLYRKKAELDAFLLAWEQAGEGKNNRPDRNTVYLQWFQQAWHRQEGAVLDSVRLVAHRRVPIFRKGNPRKTKKERPEAVFSGQLKVTDSDQFTTFLQRGIGRHRAFGFGMLLLRPMGDGEGSPVLAGRKP